jgi:maltose alpha-D-glucosyltransferase/alpha-amylase
MLHPGNRKILAYLRELDDEALLCVANVSRVAQPVELELGAYKGRVPVEMLGRNAFPPIGDLPYMLTLPGYGFFWFRLASDAEPPKWHTERLPVEDLQVVVLFDGWNSFFRNRVVPWRIAMAERTRQQLERELLPRFMLRQRWYAHKAEAPARVTLVEHALLEQRKESWLLALVDAQVSSSDSARYFVPLAIAFEDNDEERIRQLGAVAIAKVRQQASVGLLADAMADEAYCRAVVQAMSRGRELKTDGGTLHFVAGPAFDEVVGDALEAATPVRRLTASSNSVSLLGERLFLKAYRHLQAGINPELEMGRYLTDVSPYGHCVPVAGHLEFRAADGTTWTLGLLQAQVGNQGDAWTFTVEQLTIWLQQPVAIAGDVGSAPMVERMQLLGRRVGEMHLALARPSDDPAFAPEPVQASDLATWSAAVRDDVGRTFELMARQREHWAAPLVALAERVAAQGPALADRAAALAQAAPAGLKTRLHGDLHLAQVLLRDDDFVLIDFEGEPQRKLEQRRGKNSALRDVAGMLRSFDYARESALQAAAQSPADRERLAPLAREWERRVRQGFLQAYAAVVVGGGLYEGTAAFDTAMPLIELFELEKALYELRYEIDNRPDWVAVPLTGIAALAGVPA